MATKRVQVQSKHTPASSQAELSADVGAEKTRVAETVVFVVIPEYELAKVRDGIGHTYALTSRTKGVDPVALKIGQRVVCTVTRHLPRVLSAEVVE